MTSDTPKYMGDKLRDLRLHVGWTLDGMAATLGRKEASRRCRVYEWETGARIPSITVLLSYSKIFHITTDDLLDDEKQLGLVENPDSEKKEIE